MSVWYVNKIEKKIGENKKYLWGTVTFVVYFHPIFSTTYLHFQPQTCGSHAQWFVIIWLSECVAYVLAVYVLSMCWLYMSICWLYVYVLTVYVYVLTVYVCVLTVYVCVLTVYVYVLTVCLVSVRSSQPGSVGWGVFCCKCSGAEG